MFTTEPGFMSQKLVCSKVYGIIATWNVFNVGLHTVSETPLTVTLPLSTVKYPLRAISVFSGYSNVKYVLPQASSMVVQMAVWSTWPCTMWPSSLPFMGIERSTFTLSPTLSSPRLLRSKRLFHGRYGICTVADGHYCQAYSVVGDALVYLQLVGKRAS